MRPRFGGAIVVLLLLAGFAEPSVAADPALDALIRAYPEHLAGYDSLYLIWRDGTRMPLSDGHRGKTFVEMLRHGSLLDQIRLPYPTEAGPAALKPSTDP